MSSSKTRRIRRDMRENGFDADQPVDVADVDGKLVIIDGHHRTAAARQAGLKKIPIRRQKVTGEEGDRLLQEAAEAHDQ